MKKGFTLIELLAVIVILAIIALIATPIILGIINNAREEANERSVELYAAAVKNSIAAYQLTGTEAPKSFSDLTIEYDGDVKCTVQELYEDGSFYLEGCTVNGSEEKYSYGTKQGSSIEVGTMSICKPAEEQLYATEPLEAGYKYECDVDPNKAGYDYTFYVLNSTSTEVNLIMDSNINVNGEAVKSDDIEDNGQIQWYVDAQNNSYGPITAMNDLQIATLGWTNTNELTINKFTVCPKVGNCTEKPMTEYVVNARMPYYSEIRDYSASANNAYLYDYLSYNCWDDTGTVMVSCDVATQIVGVHEEGMTHVNFVYGYWTLSSNASDSRYAWHVSHQGDVSKSYVDWWSSTGLRPVITLSKTQI